MLKEPNLGKMLLKVCDELYDWCKENESETDNSYGEFGEDSEDEWDEYEDSEDSEDNWKNDLSDACDELKDSYS